MGFSTPQFFVCVFFLCTGKERGKREKVDQRELSAQKMQKIFRKIRCVGPKAVSLIQNREIPSAQSKTKMVQTRARTHAVNVRRQQLIISTNKQNKRKQTKHTTWKKEEPKQKTDHVEEDLCRQLSRRSLVTLLSSETVHKTSTAEQNRTQKNKIPKKKNQQKETKKKANQYQDHLCVEWSATEPCHEGRVYLETARTSKKLHQKKILKKQLSLIFTTAFRWRRASTGSLPPLPLALRSQTSPSSMRSRAPLPEPSPPRTRSLPSRAETG